MPMEHTCVKLTLFTQKKKLPYPKQQHSSCKGNLKNIKPILSELKGFKAILLLYGKMPKDPTDILIAHVLDPK